LAGVSTSGRGMWMQLEDGLRDARVIVNDLVGHLEFLKHVCGDGVGASLRMHRWYDGQRPSLA